LSEFLRALRSNSGQSIFSYDKRNLFCWPCVTLEVPIADHNISEKLRKSALKLRPFSREFKPHSIDDLPFNFCANNIVPVADHFQPSRSTKNTNFSLLASLFWSLICIAKVYDWRNLLSTLSIQNLKFSRSFGDQV
jgi:hypothetical protein